MASETQLHSFETKLAPSPVDYAVIVPPGYEPDGESLPLCLILHGGGGSRDDMVNMKGLFDILWADGSLPPVVLASASTAPLDFYVDVREGPQWETLIAEEFLELLRRRYNVRSDAAGTILTGASMGGHGSLKMAFRNADRYAAVAAMEPAIEPGLRRADLTARNLFYREEENDAKLYGKPLDEAMWEANNPAALARANWKAIAESGLKILLEAGDEDELNLHDGAEFLHRVLWDDDIAHDYHLVYGAGHVGPSLIVRMMDCFRWIGGVLSGKSEDTGDSAISPTEEAWIAWAQGGMSGEAPDAVDLMSPRFRRILTELNRDKLESASREDPTTARRYGRLPDSN